MNRELLFKYLLMIGLVIIFAFVCFLIGWLFLSKIVLEVDTRIARAEVRLQGIGSVKIGYDDEWWMIVSVPLYRKTIRFADIKKGSRKKRGRKVIRKKKRFKMISVLRKTIRVIRSFHVSEWQLAVDMGDSRKNAQFYYLNFLRPAYGHLHVNFNDENFMVLKMHSHPWNILYAFIR